jgi:hypothetical protein
VIAAVLYPIARYSNRMIWPAKSACFRVRVAASPIPIEFTAVLRKIYPTSSGCP